MQAKLKYVLCVIIIFVVVMFFEYIHWKWYNNRDIGQQISNIEKIEYNNTNVKDTKKIEIETDKEVDTQAIKPVSIGEFKLTAYCPCEVCCEEYAYNRPVDKNGNKIVYGAIGEQLKEDYSIAVDPEIIPYGTEVIINGNVYKAQDCGGAIKNNRIDVYFEDHNEALDFGIQYAEVFVGL